ncbi:hypothetical protein JCM8097_005330 [Rhodosporidiobolus ruineniae]
MGNPPHSASSSLRSNPGALPPDLEHFLSNYPHPVFALPAEPIFQALVARKQPYRPSTAQDGHFGPVSSRAQYEGDVSQSVPSPRPAGVNNALLEEAERAKASQGLRAAQTAKDGASSASPSALSTAASPVASRLASPNHSSLSSRRSSTSASAVSSATRASNTRANRILSDAFDAPALLSRVYPALQRSSLLEDGGQQNHHPSRTAEGAVEALYEQRAAHDAKVKKDEADEEQREKNFEDVRGRREEKEQKEFEQRDRIPYGAFALQEMLKPVWRNSKFTELMAIRDDAKPKDKQDAELDLLALLSRSDAQELLAVLTHVVEQIANTDGGIKDDVPLAKLDHTVLLELNFPPNSIYRHPPSSNFSWQHSTGDNAADSTTEDVSTADGEASRSSSSSRRPVGPVASSQAHNAYYSPSNAYAPPPSNQNPALPPTHHSVQEETRILKPFLQIVATLHQKSGLIVCTSIMANCPLPVSTTNKKDETRKWAAGGGLASPAPHRASSTPSPSASPSAPSPAAPSPARPPISTQPSLSRLTRPPLTQRHSSYSSLSTASSSNSTVVGRGGGASGDSPPIPIPSTSTSPSSQPVLPPVDRAALLEARETDNVPQPFQQWHEALAPSDRSSPPHPNAVAGADPTAQAIAVLDQKIVKQSYPRRLPVEIPGQVSGGGGDGAGGGLAYPQPQMGQEEAAESPSLGADLTRELWTDGYTSRVVRPPSGFLTEKEARAARRRAAVAKTTAQERREEDNDERERQWQARLKREKVRERDKQVARAAREDAGLGELQELDEPRSDEEDDGMTQADADELSEMDEEDSPGPGVRAFDEEGENEMDALRRKTRTGSTSSAGSSRHGREDEQAEEEAADRRSILEADVEVDNRHPPTVVQSPVPHDSPVSSPRPPPFRHHSSGASATSTASRASSSRPGSYTLSVTGSHPSSGGGTAIVRVHEPEAAQSQSWSDAFLTTLSQTPCGRAILAVDWASTSLGDIRTWGPELRSHVMVMLASPFHEALWMGEDNVLLYNDAYARILGERHPSAMGKAGALGWSEVWDVLGPLASQVMLGKTVSFADHCICHIRNGMLEETYHSWAYITLRDSQGKVIGYTNPSFETTARVIAERRLGTLRELTQLTSLARTMKDFCQKALRALSTNALDLPFAILYSVKPVQLPPGRRTKGSTESSGARRGTEAPTQTATGDSARADASGRMHLSLQGTVGVPAGHPSAVDEVEVLVSMGEYGDGGGGGNSSSASSVSSMGGTNSTNDDNCSSTVWPFVEALQSRKPVFISDVGERADGFMQRGWPDPVTRAVAIPIMSEGSMTPKALLIVGLNPRRPWNEVMATFLSLIARTLSTGILGIEVAEEAARKSQEMAQLMSARQMFFSNISHELRTPLTLILGPLEDVLADKTSHLTTAQREQLDIVQRNASRLHNMVNTLLDFSRLESGKMDATFHPTQLGRSVADLASLFRAAIERGGIDFQIEVEDDKWADRNPFYLSSEMLEKLVFNILGNAFKYTLAGTIVVRVQFSPTEGIIAVQDSGVGIKDEDLSVIFDRFQRVDSSARSFEGSGIGLSLVLELVKTLGGQIDVESEVGKGSTFRVRLPRGFAHLPPEAVRHEPYEAIALPARSVQSRAIIDDAAAWRIESKPLPAPPAEGDSPRTGSPSPPAPRRSSDAEPIPAIFDLSKQNTRVLVVDDNEQLRRFISSTLSKTFTVIGKSNGQEALEYCLKNPVNLVVTDLSMPIMGGQDLLLNLRKNPSTALVPVIFLSAAAGTEARVDALLLGAEDYLVKPFQARELVARVNVHLQLGAMRMELERRVHERTAELVESEKKYRQLADQHQTLALVSPVGIFQTDREGNMLFVNPQFMEITGHPPDTSHTEWNNDVHPDDLERVRALWTAATANWHPDKPTSTFEYRYRNGKYAQLELRAYEKGYIGSITDMTHVKEVEHLHISAIESRAEEAEQNRRNMEAFVDMASHELRNPLSGVWQNAEVVASSIDSFIDFLADLREGKPATPSLLEEMHQEALEDADAVASIILCASHQQRIADDILNVSKLNMGLLSINVAPFCLVSSVREVVKTFEVQAHQQAIQLTVDESPSLAALQVDWIVADSGRVKQVIYNFLTNALKYTADSDRKAVTVHVEAFASAPPVPDNARRVVDPDQKLEAPVDCVWVSCSVEDSGKGLTAEQLNLLFMRWAQANPKSDQYGGSGLGLYVSKKLVELHRGFIEVESTLGQGSIFRFAIPAARAAHPSPSELTVAAPSRPASKRSKRPQSSSGRPAHLVSSLVNSPPPTAGNGVVPLHVCVVEDNLINRKVMMRQLKDQGFQVSLADDGKEALDVLIEDNKRYTAQEPNYSPIRVVLCDIEMPVMDGMTFVKEKIRMEKSGELSRHYPTCAVTGNARIEQQQLCRDAGFDDVAVKPYRLAELLQQISKLAGLPIAGPR